MPGYQLVQTASGCDLYACMFPIVALGIEKVNESDICTT